MSGYKLVAKRATRKWVDDAAAETLFRHKRVRVKDFTKRVLKSPAEMEKVFKKLKRDPGVLAKIYSKTSSGTTLAPEDDPRPAMMGGKAALKALADRMAG